MESKKDFQKTCRKHGEKIQKCAQLTVVKNCCQFVDKFYQKNLSKSSKFNVSLSPD
jgi:hypothetical protein